jgi:hypothetical protein
MRRAWTAAGAVIVAAAVLGAPGSAGAKSRVIVKPKAGQEIAHHPVRFVVRAGPEAGDLRARLNGVAIGRHFLVKRRGVRVLGVSNSHGLHHGRNVLKVVARSKRGTRIRRSKVRFDVTHKRPLTGAGRDRRIVRGSRFELNGQVVEHPNGRSGDRVRWKILRAPRGSRLRPGGKSRLAGAAPALRQATSLSPTLKPDVVGAYKLRMTTGKGTAATQDKVTLNAVHPSPLVPLDIAVPASAAEPRPGIKVGDTIYRAPYLREVGGVGTFLEPGGSNIPAYTALFQVLALNRHSLEFGANWTYGNCTDVGDNSSHICRKGDNGEPVEVNPANDFRALGNEWMLIVSPLPGAIPDSALGWAKGNAVEFALGPLSTIGFPATYKGDGAIKGDPDMVDRLRNSATVPLTMIGVPGMGLGDADISIGPEMNGFLTHDNSDQPAYGFVPAQRAQFDTRLEMNCDNGAGTCVWQGIGAAGDPDPNQDVQNGTGGYLVSIYDRSTLRRQGFDFFTTVGNPSGAAEQVAEMTNYIAHNRYRGLLFAITSLHTPGLAQPKHLVDASVSTDTWSALTDQIVALGGTKHRFNTAASTPGSDYSLIGFPSYRGGSGSEVIGPGARIRGGLAPDRFGLFAPMGVTTNGPAHEKLTQLVLRAPDPKWPLDDDRGASNALRYIGQKLGIGYDVRAAYWTQSMSASEAHGFVQDLQCDTSSGPCSNTPKMPANPPPAPNDFTAADFTRARGQLIDELGYISKVRNYLTHLAYPLGDSQNTDPWEQAQTLETNLTQQLKDLTDAAQMEFDVLGFIKSLADVAGLLIGVPDVGSLAAKAAKAFKTIATASEFAKVFIDAKYGGAPGSDVDSGPIQATKLGERLQAEAQATATSFKRMGDIIVSDWSKLQELGQNGHANCNPVPGGCAEGFEEYAWTSEIGEVAADSAAKALERTIYNNLVTLSYAYPVWDTGLSAPCDQPCGPPDAVEQNDCGYYNPFSNDHKLAWFSALEVLDPSGVSPRWRTYLSVARSGVTYGWASDAILGRMFDPKHQDADTGKPDALDMDPLDFFTSAQDTWYPRGTGEGVCDWSG